MYVLNISRFQGPWYLPKDSRYHTVIQKTYTLEIYALLWSNDCVAIYWYSESQKIIDFKLKYDINWIKILRRSRLSKSTSLIKKALTLNVLYLILILNISWTQSSLFLHFSKVFALGYVMEQPLKLCISCFQ